MLYLVSTPIGNRADISLRAIETLRLCDYILCEDTRHSKPLLTYYQVERPLKSFHKFSEKGKEETVVRDLLDGKTIGLISDAGTPGIADPGSHLVARCCCEGITITAIPGPCAAIAALSCSGLATDRFQFVGFLPKQAGQRRAAIQEYLLYPGTTICYESPNRVLSSIKAIASLAPDRQLAIARELTKRFEEIVRGSAEELVEKWRAGSIKGEIVLLISGDEAARHAMWQTLAPKELANLLQENYQLEPMAAIKLAAELQGLPKRALYRELKGG